MGYKFFTRDEANYISEMYNGTNSVRKKRFEKEFFDLHYDELLKGTEWGKWINVEIRNPSLNRNHLEEDKVDAINISIVRFPIKDDSDLDCSKKYIRHLIKDKKIEKDTYIKLITYILYSDSNKRVLNLDDLDLFLFELSVILKNDDIKILYKQDLLLIEKENKTILRNKIIDFLNDYKNNGMDLFEIQNKYFIETYKYRKLITDDFIKILREDIINRNTLIQFELKIRNKWNELYNLFNILDFPLLTTNEKKNDLREKFDKAYLINRYNYPESNNRPPKGYEDLEYINYQIKDYYNIANEDADVFRHIEEYDIVEILSYYYFDIKNYHHRYKYRSFSTDFNNDKEMIAELIISNFKFHINKAFLRVIKKNLPIIDSYFIEEEIINKDNNDTIDEHEDKYKAICYLLNDFITYVSPDKIKKIIQYKINNEDINKTHSKLYFALYNNKVKDAAKIGNCFCLSKSEITHFIRFNEDGKRTKITKTIPYVKLEALTEGIDKVLFKIRNEYLHEINPNVFPEI